MTIAADKIVEQSLKCSKCRTLLAKLVGKYKGVFHVVQIIGQNNSLYEVMARFLVIDCVRCGTKNSLINGSGEEYKKNKKLLDWYVVNAKGMFKEWLPNFVMNKYKTDKLRPLLTEKENNLLKLLILATKNKKPLSAEEGSKSMGINKQIYISTFTSLEEKATLVELGLRSAK